MHVAKRTQRAIAMVAVLLGLLATRLYGYTLFHSLTEAFTVAVAAGVFMVMWNARGHLDNGYLRTIGVAYLFVAFVDLLHMLAYRGMGVFTTYDPFDLPTQLWLMGRYLQVSAMVAGPLVVARHVRMRRLFIGYFVGTTALLASVFVFDVFPTALVEGSGLTPFKIGSEYVVAGLMVVSVWLLRRVRDRFDPAVLRLLTGSIWLFVASELAFTLYVDPFGTFNLIGHLLRIVAFYLAYRAVVATALIRPQDVIFRGLSQREEAERHARQDAEHLVAELLDSESELAAQAEEAQARYVAERRVADTLQRALLEAPSHLSDVEIGHVYASATARDGLVGGDFLEAFEIDDSMVVMVGDVSGKGLEAAVLGTLARGALKTHTVDGLSPCESTTKVNETLYRFSTPETFVTAITLVLDRSTGEIAYCNAGHPAAFVIAHDGSVRELDGLGGLMMGAFSGAEYSDGRARIEPGDMVLLLTDGVLEARRGTELWGVRGLRAHLAAGEAGSPADLVEGIHAAVQAFSGGAADDDIALVAFRWSPAGLDGSGQAPDALSAS